MRRLGMEILGYALASACALAVDMALLWVLVNFLSWGYLAAATTSFCAGTVVAYEFSVMLAFHQHRLQNRRYEFASFAAIGLLGLAVNAAVIFMLVEYGGFHFLLAKCVAAGFTFTTNFVVRRQTLFVRSSPAA